MDDQKGPRPDQNEGEGNKTADKKYRDAATDFARRNDTLQTGLQAEREVENCRDGHDKAEKTGRAHSAGELRTDRTGEDLERKE
jgi:hypothetical protein